MKELKSTPFKPSISVLGSREQLCVHPKVEKMSGTQQSFACRQLASTRKCKYYNNIAQHVSRLGGVLNIEVDEQGNQLHQILDIEDLRVLGKGAQVHLHALLLAIFNGLACAGVSLSLNTRAASA